jgi:UDP-N-acetyl-D-galactosamine dehydrogenase
MELHDVRIAVIGLGYVGLPLAVAFGKTFKTVGFDTAQDRIDALQVGIDQTGENEDIGDATHLTFASDLDAIRHCNVYIVAVPTPIDSDQRPDLTALIRASETVGAVLVAGDMVIYESTVYPGATEDDCIPVVERCSGLRFNQDFFAGYSPERINPGDKARPITKIVKVTSGSTPEAADFVDALYRAIIPAGTFKAASIRVAEAAKVIENTQRDVNIALINELSMVFARMGIDTMDVIDAASTKWNFMRLQPGLVGGHCIGVDPYYLLHRSQKAGHIPDIIRMARELNNGMPREVAQRLVRAMLNRNLPITNARVLIMGVTFKENCADVRNTKVVDLIHALREWQIDVTITDPAADAQALKQAYGLDLQEPVAGSYHALILAVPHAGFLAAGPGPLREYLVESGLFFDLKSVFDKSESDLRL